MIVFFWVVLSLVAGAIGAKRTSGFWGTFIASLFLSPLIGFIIALASRPVEQVEYERRNMAHQKAVSDSIRMISQNQKSIAEQIADLKSLLDRGDITAQQYDAAVQKITGS